MLCTIQGLGEENKKISRLFVQYAIITLFLIAGTNI